MRDNQVNDISSLKDLKNLTELDLSWNQVSDISPLKELIKLGCLNLSGNPIEELPVWITEFNMEFKWATGFRELFLALTSMGENGYITYTSGTLKTPPPEIVKQGKEAVRNYFEQIKEQGKDKIYEAKLMIVGEPGSGKTTLMNMLFDKDFPVPNDEQKATPGIEVCARIGSLVLTKRLISKPISGISVDSKSNTCSTGKTALL